MRVDGSPYRPDIGTVGSPLADPSARIARLRAYLNDIPSSPHNVRVTSLRGVGNTLLLGNDAELAAGEAARSLPLPWRIEQPLAGRVHRVREHQGVPISARIAPTPVAPASEERAEAALDTLDDLTARAGFGSFDSSLTNSQSRPPGALQAASRVRPPSPSAACRSGSFDVRWEQVTAITASPGTGGARALRASKWASCLCAIIALRSTLWDRTISQVVQYPSRRSGLEDGPKNPSPGTSMKFLVGAFDAQSGAVAGS